jgi:hypothetical protein
MKLSVYQPIVDQGLMAPASFSSDQKEINHSAIVPAAADSISFSTEEKRKHNDEAPQAAFSLYCNFSSLAQGPF